jgi:precorrin isomerase
VITKGERIELRSLIRQRFKVLRADVGAREAELLAELQERIVARFAADDKAWADAMYLIEEAAREANRKANDILRGLNMEGIDLDGKDLALVTAKYINKPATGRNEMRRTGATRIEAQVRAAQQQLNRQEVELLTRLATSALESEEARAFLGEIPTVSSLVPADRLLELEQSLREDGAS